VGPQQGRNTASNWVATATGMPFWLLMRCTISPARLSRADARRSIAAARCAGCQCAQPFGSSKARLAAPTAASISASTASGTCPMTCSVLAETTVVFELDAGVIHSPPTYKES